MIEVIPDRVDRVFVYFHSAGANAQELAPFLDRFQAALPHTAILALDGFLAGSPMIHRGAFYGEADERYWFMFPMSDACSQESFQTHKAALGATLLTAAAYTNHWVDQIRDRFGLPTSRIFLGGFQHGSCLVLATAMMRQHDPLPAIFLIQPYLMEAYYLENELRQPATKVYGFENEFMRKRTYGWIQIYTETEMEKLGVFLQMTVTQDGEEHLTEEIMDRVATLLRAEG